MPFAARITDMHLCPIVFPKPHVGGIILPPGVPNVFIGGLPAAVVGNTCQCISPLPDVIVKGSMSVLINNRPAARLGDTTLHGGNIITGCPTVIIGG